MHPKALRGLCKRNAPLLDQPHSLKLELLRKLPSLHDPPPAPSKHLTRCLRNRVQATTHILCCSCGAYFESAASSENCQGSMNFDSNPAPDDFTRPSSVAPSHPPPGDEPAAARR